jgi:peptidoglycan hydrolase CwlO-like protein
MSKRILFAIVLIAIALSTTACSAGVSPISVNMSPRVADCSTSDLQQILNAAEQDASTWTGTTDEWLDQAGFACIQ